MNSCLCDGRYDGCTHGKTCDQPGGGHRSPYFCAECDPRRIDQIGRDLRELLAGFEEAPDDED